MKSEVGTDVPDDAAASRQSIREQFVDLGVEPSGNHVVPRAAVTAVDEDFPTCEWTGRDALPCG